jgi:hypothetical protein
MVAVIQEDQAPQDDNFLLDNFFVEDFQEPKEIREVDIDNIDAEKMRAAYMWYVSLIINFLCLVNKNQRMLMSFDRPFHQTM